MLHIFDHKILHNATDDLNNFIRKNTNGNNLDLNNPEIKDIFNFLSKPTKKTKIIDIYLKIIDLLEFIPIIKYLDSFKILLKILELFEKIFIKFKLENKLKLIPNEIKEFNLHIISFFKFYLFNDMQILQRNFKEDMICSFSNYNENDNNKENKSNSKDIIKIAFTDLIIKNFSENLKLIKKIFNENFYEKLNDNLCFFNIISPKNNSIFKHSIKNEVLPFFLEINIRVSNIEYTENILIELIKNLDITLITLNDEIDIIKKNYSISFSNTRIFKNEFER